jgi:hypothetical protein
MRSELQLNAAVLAQVAFNLWMSNNEAQSQAAKLLKFRRGPVTDLTLGRLWNTAHDLSLVSGQSEVRHVPGVHNSVILTFDEGLAGLRGFFEHIDLPTPQGREQAARPSSLNARVRMDFHPGLEHMRPRVVKLTAALHADALARIASAGGFVGHDERILALIEGEEQDLLSTEY